MTLAPSLHFSPLNLQSKISLHPRNWKKWPSLLLVSANRWREKKRLQKAPKGIKYQIKIKPNSPRVLLQLQGEDFVPWETELVPRLSINPTELKQAGQICFFFLVTTFCSYLIHNIIHKSSNRLGCW